MNPNAESAASPLRNNRTIWMAVASIMAAGLVTADAGTIDADGFGLTPGDLPNVNSPTPFFAGGWDANAAWGGGAGTVLQVQGVNASYPGIDAGPVGSLAVGSQSFSDGWAG